MSSRFDTFEGIAEIICSKCMAATENCDGYNDCPFSFSKLEALCSAVDAEADSLASQAENYEPLTWDQAYFNC